MAASQRRSLAAVAAESGVAVPSAGNLPLDFDDPGFVWFVAEGAVDLFVAESAGGVEQAAPEHLLRATAGRLVPGVASRTEETTLRLIAKGLPGAELRRLPVAALAGVRLPELAEQLDAWLGEVSAVLSRYAAHSPRPDRLVEPGGTVAAAAGGLSARRGVAWVSAPPAGAALFLGLLDPAEGRAAGAPARPIPLTRATWLTLMEAVPLAVRSTESLAGEGILLDALADFHALAFRLDRLNRRLAVVDEANLARMRTTVRRRDEEEARRRLFDLHGLSDDGTEGMSDAALRGVLQLIGRHEGIDFSWPPRTDDGDSARALGAVLDASGVRARQVRLSRDDRWWMGDSGALLAFRTDTGRPVALLPGALGRYRAVESAGRRGVRVTAARAGGFRTEAWMFYPPLTAARPGLRDLLRLARKGWTVDLARTVGVGILGGLAALVPAVVLGLVVDEVIPAGDVGLLYLLTGALAVAGLLGALVHVLRGMALMRLEGRVASRIEAAFWDRLLRLPPAFLRRYPAGDLAMRGMTFQRLRDGVQGVVANAVLSVVFLSPAFLLIFLHDAVLGGVTTAVGLLSLIVTVGFGLRQVAPQARVIRAVRGLAGRLFQLINGISTLRGDGAEGAAFAVWADGYREQKQAELEVGALEERLQALSAAMPFLAAAVLLLAVAIPSREVIAVGDFLVVYTAFMVFQAAVARLGASFSAVAAILPAFDQVRPLLAEPPETGASGAPVESLGGEIRFDHVSFRYHPEGPLILDDVSIRVHPGEFVAIAGDSGAGKSTLLRLALGLLQPSAGAIYYDGRDLAQLNVRQLRRLVGVAPQNVQLHPDDLWDNIVGGHEEMTEDEAWEAARQAAVARDIQKMPMQMMTAVGTGAGVLSGGESQRVAISQALIRNPHVLLLDEATNWLDNDSQAEVMRNLARLTSTRVVIAHRVSTLRHADRIYVMRAGKVIQEGAFEELASNEGVFRGLVQRQLA